MSGIRLAEVELSRPMDDVWGLEGHSSLRLLARHQGRPIGWIDLPGPFGPILPAEAIRAAAMQQVGWQIGPPELGGWIETPEAAAATPVSVVVCTRNRPEHLEGCLRALRRIEHPAYEIVVVDNASDTDDAAALAARYGARHVAEPIPGLDRARNRGVEAARHGIVAFTDDDARPDRLWLSAIAAAFGQPEVMAVTGFVAPFRLVTRAEILFELHYGGMGHGFRRRVIRRRQPPPAGPSVRRLVDRERYWRDELPPRDLLWASSFGVGANMAFRRELFDRIGGFDPALDVGTPSHGAGDVEMFHRLVAAGHTLVYEPAALVRHLHRIDMKSLRDQLRDNGRSFGCYLLTCARNRTVRRASIAAFLVRDWLRPWILRRLRRPGVMPRSLILAELAGMLGSPFAYRATRAHARRLDAAVGAAPSPRGATPRRRPSPSVAAR
jgi:glycosyltransferase involved in cell wall biosynthesis